MKSSRSESVIVCLYHVDPPSDVDATRPDRPTAIPWFVSAKDIDTKVALLACKRV
jgi:hypothetical protein